MLTLVALGALVAAGVLTIRWVLTRTDSLGRSRAFPVYGVGLLVLLSVGAAVPVIHHAQQEARFANAATALIGTKVSVHCQTAGETFVDVSAELGYVKYNASGRPEHKTLIKREQCRDLVKYGNSNKTNPSQQQVIAVHVLTHEAMHMSGITDEAAAECAAVQRDARLARLLGASASAAATLAKMYWQSVYPYMPGDYRSAECRSGGSLDEHLAEAPWS